MSLYSKVRATLVLALLSVLVWKRWAGGMHGAVWYPSNQRAVRQMLDAAKILPGEQLYDLGTGDGRIAVESARSYGAHATGIELDPFRCAWARSRARRSGVSDSVRIVRADFHKQSLGGADIVTCYLTQAANDRLQPKLARELRPGARVISLSYRFSGPRFEPMEPTNKSAVHAYRMVGPRE